MRIRLRRTGKRAEVFIATKFGFTPQGIRGDPEYVKEAAERSCQKLGVECIDLYYLHRYCPSSILLLCLSQLIEGLIQIHPSR